MGPTYDQIPARQRRSGGDPARRPSPRRNLCACVCVCVWAVSIPAAAKYDDFAERAGLEAEVEAGSGSWLSDGRYGAGCRNGGSLTGGKKVAAERVGKPGTNARNERHLWGRMV